MGLLDNDTVIVDAILTKKGRQKLANGQPLGITQYAFGDTGVDYTLYNASHPSGSSAYGSAITSLPMLEAVPDDDVFLRFKLYGDGDRNVQNFAYISVSSGEAVTIEKIAGETKSQAIQIIANVNPEVVNANFEFKVMDMRGLTSTDLSQTTSFSEAGFNSTTLPPGSHPDPVQAVFKDITQLNLNAVDQQISSEKTIGVQITRDGAAPTFVNVTIQANTQA